MPAYEQWCEASAWGGWTIVMIAAALLVGLVVWGARGESGRMGTPEDILRRRYAEGEIGRDEFERMINELYQ